MKEHTRLATDVPPLYIGVTHGGTIVSDLKEYLDKQLSDPEFAKEYQKQRSEYETICEKIRVQASSNAQSLKKTK